MDEESLFIDELKRAVIDDNLSAYIDMIKRTKAEDIKNDHWRFFVEIIQARGDAAVDAIETVFRQVMVDTLANTLGILDGSSILKTMRGVFIVSYNGKALPQTLADTFLESEEQ